MGLRKKHAFFAVAIAFMALGVVFATDDKKGGAAVWIALGAAFMAIGAAKRASDKGGKK